MKPKRKQWDIRFPIWVEDLEDTIDSTLRRRIIKGGFANAGIVPLFPNIVLDPLPDNIPSYLQIKENIRKSTLFDISNKVVTDEEFLAHWLQDIESKRKMKEEKINEKTEKKILIENRNKKKNKKKMKICIKKTKRKREWEVDKLSEDEVDSEEEEGEIKEGLIQ
jgi:hypothetical protein